MNGTVVSSGKDFRKAKIHPTIDDINRQNETKLLPNLIHQSYESSDHYFKTQFNLLREESVRPLVEAVNKLKQILRDEPQNGRHTDNEINVDHKQKLRQLIDKEVESNVYFDIKLTDPFVDLDYNSGPLLKFTFDYKPIENIDLVDCQHLMDGSILCLSSDKFQKSIVFGVITKCQIRERDPQTKSRLWNFCLKLDFDNNTSKHFIEFLLKPKTRYIGVESPAYFEGFRHSLLKLQNMAQDFPFNRYIVGIPKRIETPPYLTHDSTYDMSCIKLQKSKDMDPIPDWETKPNPLSSVKLMKNDVFGEERVYKIGTEELKEFSTFDIKQFDAFYAALTKELCIIEGPPGTGKTFVGLKIVESLLNNSQVWNPSSEVRPILIVCYKNHALDQFLEGIVKFNQNVVRIGGNSESKALETYKLGTLEKKFCENLELQKESKIQKVDPKLESEYKKCARLRTRIRKINNYIFGLNRKIENSFKTILDSEELKSFIKPKSLISSDYFSTHSLNDWLNSENDINFTKVCEKQLNKKRLLLNCEAFDEVDTLIKRNVLELNAAEKWLIYLYWRELFFKNAEKEIKEKTKTITEEIEKLKSKKVDFHRMLCKGAQVIGLTITGAAKYSKLVEVFNPQIMIVEEAAEVLEGHIVAALCSTVEHLILIGDHKQLRPLTNIQELTDDYKLDISLFERLVENKLPFIQLELQHRMRPCISQLLKVGKIYDNLRNDEKVLNYPDIKYTFGKNMYFIDHQHIEDNNFCRDVQDKSRSNLYEARYVIELVKYFLLRNYPEDSITVLATYNAQLSLIRNLMYDQRDVFAKEVEVDNLSKSSKYKTMKIIPQNLSEELGEVKSEDKPDLRVRVSSVDGFQGEENDIIIISFVRSSKRNAIGFLDNKNRVNVALSRAKHALYCVGNFTVMAKEEKTQMWAPIVKHLSSNNCFGEEFEIGCECTGKQVISMPGQLQLLNLQIKNGRCKCSKPK